MGWLRRWLHKHDTPDIHKPGQLPGSKERIEKAMVFPTSDAPNPFLKRLDPAKEIKSTFSVYRPPSPQPGETNPFLTDDGELQPGLAPPK